MQQNQDQLNARIQQLNQPQIYTAGQSGMPQYQTLQQYQQAHQQVRFQSTPAVDVTGSESLQPVTYSQVVPPQTTTVQGTQANFNAAVPTPMLVQSVPPSAYGQPPTPHAGPTPYTFLHAPASQMPVAATLNVTTTTQPQQPLNQTLPTMSAFQQPMPPNYQQMFQQQAMPPNIQVPMQPPIQQSHMAIPQQVLQPQVQYAQIVPPQPAQVPAQVNQNFVQNLQPDVNVQQAMQNQAYLAHLTPQQFAQLHQYVINQQQHAQVPHVMPEQQVQMPVNIAQFPQNFQQMQQPMMQQFHQQLPNQNVLPEANAFAQALFQVGESRDDKRRKEDKINKLKFGSFTPQTGTSFIAQIQKQLTIHGVDPEDPDVKSPLLAKTYSSLPMDIQVACEANDFRSMINFIELMSERFTSDADIVAVLRREVSSSNPQLMWTKFQQMLKTLTPEATNEQVTIAAWRSVRTMIYANTPFYQDIIKQLTPPSAKKMTELIEAWKFRMGRMPHASPYVHAILEGSNSPEKRDKSNSTTSPQSANVTPAPHAQVSVPSPSSSPGKNTNGNAAKMRNGKKGSPQQTSAQGPQYLPSPNYSGAMIMNQQQMPSVLNTTRPDTHFQQMPVNYNNAQVPQSYAQVVQPHDTNAPAGNLVTIGVKACPNHQMYGGRCKVCTGHGCEWQQYYDPVATNNPQIPPLKTYGEVMREREQHRYRGNDNYNRNYRPQGNYNNRSYGQGNYYNGNRPQYAQGQGNYYNSNRPPPQQHRDDNRNNFQQSNQNAQAPRPQVQNGQPPSVNAVHYFGPPATTSQLRNANGNQVASGSGNAVGAPSPRTGRQC